MIFVKNPMGINKEKNQFPIWSSAAVAFVVNEYFNLRRRKAGKELRMN